MKPNMISLFEKINGWHPVLLSIAAVGFSFTNVEVILKIAVLSVTLGYGIWKWIHEYRKSKKK